MNNINHFIDLPDVPPQILKAILKNAHMMKRNKFAPPQIFAGLSLAMVFDKRSTRTRMSFEVAMKQLGGHVITMNAEEMQITGAESIEDTAQVLSRFVDAVMIRMSNHAALVELSKYAKIPVINGLTDHSHPCQIMADLMTIEEKLGNIQGKKIAWLGDYNNVARTFEQAAPVFGFELVLAAPEEILSSSRRKPGSSGQTDKYPGLRRDDVKLVTDPAEAAENADVIVTDTWVSMGQEGKTTALFEPYQVTMDLMKRAKPHALFMHCMPIHRGEEVTDEVLASKHSVIYDEAENRLHAQKSILAWCLKNAGVHIQQSLFEFAA